MTKVYVFNRNRCKSIFQYGDSISLTQFGKYIIISINDLDQQYIKFRRWSNCLDIAYLRFEDTDDEENPASISRADAKLIADTVNRHKNEADSIIVHCAAGVSRSAGCAAAISLYINGYDKEFFERPYCPNRLVYRRVLEAFGLTHSFQDSTSKFDYNLEQLMKEIDND